MNLMTIFYLFAGNLIIFRIASYMKPAYEIKNCTLTDVKLDYLCKGNVRNYYKNDDGNFSSCSSTFYTFEEVNKFELNNIKCYCNSKYCFLKHKKLSYKIRLALSILLLLFDVFMLSSYAFQEVSDFTKFVEKVCSRNLNGEYDKDLLFIKNRKTFVEILHEERKKRVDDIVEKSIKIIDRKIKEHNNILLRSVRIPSSDFIDLFRILDGQLEIFNSQGESSKLQDISNICRLIKEHYVKMKFENVDIPWNSKKPLEFHIYMSW